MASLFESTNYRRILADQAGAWKKRRAGWTLARLATQAGLQAPYLTNVLKERAHLSADQLFTVGRILGFDELEQDYVLRLLDWERSTQRERRARLQNEISRLQKERLKAEAHLKAEVVDAPGESTTRYWINPELQLVHAFLGVPRFAKNLGLIAESLSLEAERVDALVKELKELGMVRIGKDGIEKTKTHLHLSKESALCAPQQLLLHYRSLQHQQLLSAQSKLNFAVTFTGDEKTRGRIHAEFLKFLEKAEGLVKQAPSESVYQMNFDLFPWSR